MTASSAPPCGTSGYPQVNLAWMWGALLAATMAAWLHQLTAITAGEDILAGHGVRGGKAMIATLRWRLIAVPGWSATPATWSCGFRPDTSCCPRSWPGYGNCPSQPDLRLLSLGSSSLSAACQPRPEGRSQPANPAPAPGRKHAWYQESWRPKIIYEGSDQLTALFAESGQRGETQEARSRVAPKRS